MKIAVLIPVFNESSALGELIDSVRQKGLDICVVDDGSTDGSGDIARAAGVAVLVNQERSGKGTSLRRGFDHLLEQGYDGIIMMDGDGQHKIKDIDSFLEIAKKDPDSIIIGNRMNNVEGMPLLRRWTNRLMSFLISLVSRQWVPDTQCGYRYLGAMALEQMPLTCSGFEIETEIIIKASRRRVKIHSVPIRTVYRNEVSKIDPLRDTIRFFVYFFKEINPFRKK